MVLLKEVKEVKSTVRGKLFQILTIRWLKNCERQLIELDYKYIYLLNALNYMLRTRVRDPSACLF